MVCSLRMGYHSFKKFSFYFIFFNNYEISFTKKQVQNVDTTQKPIREQKPQNNPFLSPNKQPQKNPFLGNNNNAVQMKNPFVAQMAKDLLVPKKRLGFKSFVKKQSSSKYDIAHKIPYNAIKSLVLNIQNKNGKISPKERTQINALTIPKRNFGKLKKGNKMYQKQVIEAIEGKNYRETLSLLNSSIPNLRAGNSKINRSIQDNPDRVTNDKKAYNTTIKLKQGKKRRLSLQSDGLAKAFGVKETRSSGVEKNIEDDMAEEMLN